MLAPTNEDAFTIRDPYHSFCFKHQLHRKSAPQQANFIKLELRFEVMLFLAANMANYNSWWANTSENHSITDECKQPPNPSSKHGNREDTKTCRAEARCSAQARPPFTLSVCPYGWPVGKCGGLKSCLADAVRLQLNPSYRTCPTPLWLI